MMKEEFCLLLGNMEEKFIGKNEKFLTNISKKS